MIKWGEIGNPRGDLHAFDDNVYLATDTVGTALCRNGLLVAAVEDDSVNKKKCPKCLRILERMEKK